MNRKIVLVGLSSLLVVCQTVLARAPLTFEDRVKAQEAIERVYYNHRIWPKENHEPKPPFEQMVSRAMLEAKVTDYLKKSAALGEFWQRPIQPEQLQAEMDRMAKGTKDPATLKELFVALNNDPYLIAECLARPILADRLIRNWYSNDERFHGETKAKAEAALASAGGGSPSFCSEGQYQKMTFVLSKSDESATAPEKMAHGEMALDAEQFEKELFQSPDEGQPAVLEETPEAFLLVGTMVKTKNRIEVETISFPKRSLEDWLKAVEPKERFAIGSSYEFAVPRITVTTCGEVWDNGILDNVLDPRSYHTAVWTGTEMIVWGGYDGAFLNTGGRYDSFSDSWVPTSTGSNCPTGRYGHTAVWTGTDMVIWGGSDGTGYFNTGGRYNPSSDTWTPTSAETNCPTGRYGHTAVWTGIDMMIWGGSDGTHYFNTGSRYNASSDTWTQTSTGGNCPSGRYGHTAVWTGTEMMIWGGSDGTNYLNTGGRYNSSSDAWTQTSTGANCPLGRLDHTAVWTGSEMVIWGGATPYPYYTNTGGRYDPSTDTWTASSTTNCPSGRYGHTAVWTGTDMMIWGGSGASYFNTGGRYNPSTDFWTPIPTGTNCPSGRYGHTAVWTGTEMVVWGGYDSSHIYVNTGGRYNPSTDTWLPVIMNVPSSRAMHSTVWTGTEMIVWGGVDDNYRSLNTGGQYNPSTDSWAPISVGTNCPSGRYLLTAIWTGSEMIVWGGWNGSSDLNSGGRYSPSTDSWTPTSIGLNVPSARSRHTAIWTGAEMIVWGGRSGSTNTNTGGRYTPSTDTWTSTSTGTDCPVGRNNHTAVWTGTEMIAWGGYPKTNTGGRYSLSSDSWTPTSIGANCPSARDAHTAVWTGTEMIIWGGYGSICLNTGSRYNPSSDTWTQLPTGANCPTARFWHTAIWTGTEMILWGGAFYDGNYHYFSTGSRYDPSSDMWTVTSTMTGCPTARGLHTAVWTGNEMVVWGGDDGTSYQNTGGRYVPPIFLSPSILPNPMVGMSYIQTLTASYGASPYTFSVTSGSLPPGLNLFSGGGLLGAPTIEGSYSFTVAATDLNGCSGSRDYSITIAPAAPPGETAPGEVWSAALIWNDKNTVAWPSNSLATGYNLYRGVPSDLPKLLTNDIDSCVRYSGSSTDATINDDPTWVAGGFYWYLVTGTNANGEGPSGNATSGPRIVNTNGTCQ